MLAGWRIKKPRPFPYPLTLRNNISGLTIIEVLFSALLSAVLIAGFFYALSTGEFSNTLSSAKADLQAQVRSNLDWITKDVRQTVSWEIANNGPSDSHIKFRQVEGWDISSGILLLSSNFVEYSYDLSLKTITRKSLDVAVNTLATWTFYNITSVPFYTLNAGGAIVALNSTDLLTSRKLIVAVSAQKQVRGLLNTSCSLTEEVKIRNE